MSIQEDLILVKHNSDFKLLGFVDLGDEAEDINFMTSGTKQKKN